MTARLRFAAAVATLALAGGACAAKSIDPWTDGAVRAEAEDLIQQADAGALFVSEPQGSLVGARHTASGLLCTFSPGERANRIVVYEQSRPRSARGDEVGCNSKLNGVFQSLRATRFAGRDDLDSAFRDAVDTVMRATPFAQPYQGDHAHDAEVDLDGRPLPLAPHRTGRFVVELDGRKLYTRVSVAVVDGWGIKQWVTGPLEEAVAIDVEAESMMTLVLVDFAMKSEAPGAPPSQPSSPSSALP